MKKILLLIVLLLMLSGCGKEKTICSLKTEESNFNRERTLEVTFEEDKVLKFVSTIKEKHNSEKSANNAYMSYETLYNNYNENKVVSSYKKDKKNIVAIYNVDLRDIETKSINFEFDFTKNKTDFLKELKEKGYSCN